MDYLFSGKEIIGNFLETYPWSRNEMEQAIGKFACEHCSQKFKKDFEKEFEKAKSVRLYPASLMHRILTFHAKDELIIFSFHRTFFILFQSPQFYLQMITVLKETFKNFIENILPFENKTDYEKYTKGLLKSLVKRDAVTESNASFEKRMEILVQHIDSLINGRQDFPKNYLYAHLFNFIINCIHYCFLFKFIYFILI